MKRRNVGCFSIPGLVHLLTVTNTPNTISIPPRSSSHDHVPTQWSTQTVTTLALLDFALMVVSSRGGGGGGGGWWWWCGKVKVGRDSRAEGIWV